jgi:hypothetical protein
MMAPMRATGILTALALSLVLVAGCGGSHDESQQDGGSYPEWDPVFPACADYQAPAVAAAPGTKFALAVYHYNVQYVPGGLKGWKTDPNFDMDNEQVEDAIVTQGLEPIVDMYLRHPGWGTDIEMQGYMVEVMAARHPAVLDKLRTLLSAGQVQLVSVHYSDQLFLAYPRADMELSFLRNEEALATGCVQAGRSVFTQEGQFGEGLLDFLAGKGLQYAALPKNLFGYLHPGATREPLYAARGMDVVLAGEGVDQGDVSIRWTFVNDGELAPSAVVMGSAANPYFGKLYVADPAVVAAHEQEISDLEGQGYAVTSIEAAVRALRAMPAYETPPELPAILDCDWQPDDTTMLLRWMGDVGLNGDAERDNEVLTTNVRAREKVHAAQVLISFARQSGVDTAADDRDLAYAIRHLLWAQVSDASGWNPIANEVQYGLGHAARAIELCDGIATRLLAALDMPHAEVDLSSAEVRELAVLPQDPAGDPVAAPLDVTVATSRPYTVTWTQLGNGHYRVVVDFEAAPAGKAGVAAVTFPALADTVAYSPALLDGEVVAYARSEFAPDATLALPLANGLIGLGNDRWLIKDLHTVHLAAVLAPGANSVELHDNTFPGTQTGSWAFEVIDGSSQLAVGRAWTLNVMPTVRW